MPLVGDLRAPWALRERRMGRSAADCATTAKGATNRGSAPRGKSEQLWRETDCLSGGRAERGAGLDSRVGAQEEAVGTACGAEAEAASGPAGGAAGVSKGWQRATVARRANRYPGRHFGSVSCDWLVASTRISRPSGVSVASQWVWAVSQECAPRARHRAARPQSCCATSRPTG